MKSDEICKKFLLYLSRISTILYLLDELTLCRSKINPFLLSSRKKSIFPLPNHYFKFKLCLKVTMQLISPHPLKFSQFHITFYPVVKLNINFGDNAISLKIHCILRPNNANFVAGVQDVGGGECDQSWD